MYRLRGVGLILCVVGREGVCIALRDEVELGLRARLGGDKLREGSPDVVEPAEDCELWNKELLEVGKPAIEIGRLRVASLREDGGEFVWDIISCLVGMEPGGDV